MKKLGNVDKFQIKQLKNLRKSAENYGDASLYVILLDLCLDMGSDHVKDILEEVSNDLGNKYK